MTPIVAVPLEQDQSSTRDCRIQHQDKTKLDQNQDCILVETSFVTTFPVSTDEIIHSLLHQSLLQASYTAGLPFNYQCYQPVTNLLLTNH